MGSTKCGDSLGEVMNQPVLYDKVCNSKILIVGSGGIGVEIIKNVVLLGFEDITLIDLDTIEVSNLNRQFLFNRKHVGQPKSLIAAKVSKDNFASHKPTVNIHAIHNTILSPEYSVDFYRQFSVVINALDNRAARSHVNRMSLAANVPLIESGSEGYLGQVFLIKRDVSACYECDGPRQEQRTYASCTIRNTPSLPIHCIVWGKHLFAQLFGEEDADNDVSPDINDPQLKTNHSAHDNNELQTDNMDGKADFLANNYNGTKPVSTREWALSKDYDPKLLFEKLFRIDVEYLLKMGQLWENRRKPVPMTFESLSNDASCMPSSSSSMNGDGNGESLKDQRIWTLSECFEKFSKSMELLKKRSKSDGFLVWDKDDDEALDFVTSVSNFRSYCFGIERKSRFDVKSMAGNIIPAISSTNSIVGGLITLQLMHLLRKLLSLPGEKERDQKTIDQQCKEACRCIYVRKVGLNARNLISSYQLFEPNSNCLVCCTSRIPEIELSLSLSEITMSEFVEQVLFKKLGFVCPDVQIEGEPIIVWSKDDADEYSESEKESYRKKPLNQYPRIGHKTRLRVYDLLQNLTIIINLLNEEIDQAANEGLFYSLKIINEGQASTNGDSGEKSSEDAPMGDQIDSAPGILSDDDDDDVCVVEVGEKRKVDPEFEEAQNSSFSKKVRV
ncbi:ubiquitin-like activating enzyme 2 [Brevipalpus obovatus]|uniref:ubiquitin-like activating enzyme 2 n=1 Tax=Brevipalpus obovatus TaxID=246614 RepID=UPI003D9F655F